MRSLYKRKYWKAVQFALSLGALGVLGYKLWDIDWQLPHNPPSTWDWFLTGTIVTLLMILNWWFEAKKWQLLVNQFDQISFSTARKDVLRGLVWSWVIPFTAGDVFARMSGYHKRIEAARSIIYNRLSSGIVAGIMGIAGVITYFEIADSQLALSLASALLLLLLGVGYYLTVWWIWRLYALAILRYIVMATQLTLLILLVTDDLAVAWIVTGIGWIFFFRSFVPGIWGALGIRELSALLFFECCLPGSTILFATLSIWLINLVVPSFVFITYDSYREDMAPFFAKI